MTHVSHLFSLNGNTFDPEVQGLNGIVKAYKHVLPRLQFHGPTYFQPVLEFARKWAEPYSHVEKEDQKYFILLILTDGVINDMQAAIDSIIDASKVRSKFVSILNRSYIFVFYRN